MEKKSDTSDLINTITRAVECIEIDSGKDYCELFLNIRAAIANVNEVLFNAPVINYSDIDYVLSHQYKYSVKEVVDRCNEWITFVNKIIFHREEQRNNIDKEFTKLMDYAQYVDFDSILCRTKKILNGFPAETIKFFNNYYQFYSHLWGVLDTEKGIYEVIENRIHKLIDNREKFIWIYNKLEDYRSKTILCYMLLNWTTCDTKYIEQMYETMFTEYFDLDLVDCNENEVVVDIGAYTGDTAIDYINTYSKYKKIYCYEITPESFSTMKTNLSEYPDIELRNKGAGEEHGYMYFEPCQNERSCNRLGAKTGLKTEVVTIDDDIPEKVTLIKMDIEGAEQSALKGCSRHITEDRPKLLISVYHNNEDIWKIPEMIDQMRGDYKFYLRSKGLQFGPAEITLYAL